MVTHVITGGLVHLTGNPIQIILSASASRQNHKLALKVTCEALMGSPFVEEIAASTALKATFDISGFLDQPAIYSFDYPSVGALNPHDALSVNVTLDIGEVWTDSAGNRQIVWNNLTTNNKLEVMKGKLHPYELGLLNDGGKSFYSEYIMGGKFLTHQPNLQTVAHNHIPMLWYLNRWPGNHAITAHLVVTTDDGVVTPILQNFIIWDITGLVEFAFQPQHWGFAQTAGTLIVSYEFWLSDVGGDVSEHRTFLVDNNYYEKSFTFYHVNPLSGIDLIWLTGQYSEGLKTESEIAYRVAPVLSGSKMASQITISSNSQRTWDINTGPLTKAKKLALRDFLTSKQCWMVDPDNWSKVIPVNIEAGENTLFDSNKDIQNLDIKILEAHK